MARDGTMYGADAVAAIRDEARARGRAERDEDVERVRAACNTEVWQIRAKYEEEADLLRAEHKAEIAHIRIGCENEMRVFQAKMDASKRELEIEIQTLRDECSTRAQAISRQGGEIESLRKNWKSLDERFSDLAVRLGYADVHAFLTSEGDPPEILRLREENDRLLEAATSPKRDRRVEDRRR